MGTWPHRIRHRDERWCWDGGPDYEPEYLSDAEAGNIWRSQASDYIVIRRGLTILEQADGTWSLVKWDDTRCDYKVRMRIACPTYDEALATACGPIELMK